MLNIDFVGLFPLCCVLVHYHRPLNAFVLICIIYLFMIFICFTHKISFSVLWSRLYSAEMLKK